ncbi:15143_t:CDS:10 [Entrophospora sp. SA101]|nr:15143_t:CDS:10 [Entrophospora sp. SA101]
MSSSISSSKQEFNFFDVQQIKDPNNTNATPAIFQKPDITSSTSGRYVHVVDKSFNVQSFLAYDGGRITHMKQIKQKNILVTIGDDDPPAIKIWDLDKQDKSKGTPACQRTIKVNHGGKPFPVSTFAVLDNLGQIAVGLANGVVVLIKGDLYRDRHTRQKVIHERLGFREHWKSIILFIVTTNKILTYVTTSKLPPTILDDQGCGLNCAVMSDTTHEMVVAKDEAIYFYGPDGRGSCFAYDVTWFKSYLIIVAPPVSQPTRLTTTTRSALSILPGSSQHHQQQQQSSSTLYELTKVTIFDTANKVIAYMGTFSYGVRTITCEWGEKDTPTKLEILFKKNLYLLAINLAHSQKYDDTSISEIFKKYGDHLYNNGDYEGAMTQYIRTIGQLEPSYIIRKFLDAQRIHNLVNYLQELHSHNLANAEHTTLLLNCYTKLKDVARLDQFIKTDNELTFDLETAIKVCRQAGYHEHAVYLAKKFGEHDLYLKIQIEDVKAYENALEYIRKLGPFEADRNLQKYGKILLNHLPEPTTKLLIDLCTSSNNQISGINNNNSSTSNSNNNITASSSSSAMINGHSYSANDKVSSVYRPPPIRTFMSLFVDQPNYLIQFLERVSEKRWGGFGLSRKSNSSNDDSDKSSSTAQLKSKNFDLSKNSNNKNSKNRELDDKVVEKKAVWNTLLELYLSEAYLPPVITTKDAKGRKLGAPSTFAVSTETERIKEKHIRKEKALNLLKDEDVSYDINQALVLCYLAQYDDGIVYLYEKMKMYEDILRFYMAKDNTEKVIQVLGKYGQHEQSLYILALTYFSSSPTNLESSSVEILRILDYIDKHNLLPPLQVIQALSRNSLATLSMVKGYMGRRIESERKETLANLKMIQNCQEETITKRKEIEELKTVARIFQVTKCSACRGSLDLPAVHFLCRHSFHQRCLPETDRECPQCAIQNREILEIRRSQEICADKHELFFDMLEKAEDGFSVIAEYFSKNTMAFAKVID